MDEGEPVREVRAVGGLGSLAAGLSAAQHTEDGGSIPYNVYTGEGTGFSFANMNADEMANCLLNACEIFWTDKDAWTQLQVQAMNADFSWKRAANDYLDCYHRLHPEIIRYNKRRD